MSTFLFNSTYSNFQNQENLKSGEFKKFRCLRPSWKSGIVQLFLTPPSLLPSLLPSLTPYFPVCVPLSLKVSSTFCVVNVLRITLTLNYKSRFMDSEVFNLLVQDFLVLRSKSQMRPWDLSNYDRLYSGKFSRTIIFLTSFCISVSPSSCPLLAHQRLAVYWIL